jgi:hypothetical protein
MKGATAARSAAEPAIDGEILRGPQVSLCRIVGNAREMGSERAYPARELQQLKVSIYGEMRRVNSAVCACARLRVLTKL